MANMPQQPQQQPLMNHQFNQTSMPQLHSQQQPALLPTPTPIFQQHQQQNNASIQNIQPQQHQQPILKQTTGNENNILIVRKIPDQLNNPDKMRQHFSKFGQILDIQCQFDQKKDAAFIQFATNQQAFAAYKSPQSVLNNRFIRLYWYSNYLKQQNNPTQQQSQQQLQQQHQSIQDEPAVKKPAKERLSFNKPNEIHDSDLVNPLNKENNSLKTSTSASSLAQATSTGSLVRTVFNNNNEKQVSEASEPTNLDISELSLKSDATKAVINEAAKLQEENKKKALMLQMEVKKKAKELMEQQIKDQKLLLQKYEQAKTVEEKSQILALVKKLSDSIEKETGILNGKFTTDRPVKPAPPPPHHLKLNNKRLNNTNFLKTTGGGSPNLNKTYPSPGAAGMNKINSSPVTNPFSFSRVSVDRRPKQLLFTGLENEQEKTNIINLINQIGCQIENTNDQQPLSLTVNFLTRKDAEIVSLYKCRIFFLK
jgi:hypothetical protein